MIKELIAKGYTKSDAESLLVKIKSSKPNDALRTIFSFLDAYGMKDNYRFEPTLARSFNYSTGTIWEIVDPAFTTGSMAGCERFDSLVGKFSNKNVPAVGFAVGFDRTIVAMDELGLFPNLKTKTMAVMTVFNESLLESSQKIAEKLRASLINTDLYPDPTAKLEKQLKYADNKGVPYVIIQGPEEKAKEIVKLKNMQTKEQFELTLDDVIRLLTKDN